MRFGRYGDGWVVPAELLETKSGMSVPQFTLEGIWWRARRRIRGMFIKIFMRRLYFAKDDPSRFTTFGLNNIIRWHNGVRMPSFRCDIQFRFFRRCG